MLAGDIDIIIEINIACATKTMAITTMPPYMPTHVVCHIVCCTCVLYASCGRQIFSCICLHLHFTFAHAQQHIVAQHGRVAEMIDRRSAAVDAQPMQTPQARVAVWYKVRTINK